MKRVIALLRENLPWTLTAAGVYFADAWSKAWCFENLKNYDRLPIFGQDYLVISKVLNRGVMGDRFSGLPAGTIEYVTRYLPALSGGLLAAFALLRWRDAGRLEKSGYAAMLAGGFSNLWDHWHSVFVVDTLQIYSGGGEHIPFNIADLGLVLGAALVLGAWTWASRNSAPAPQVAEIA
jgi:lipoprotein signal peptidase